MKTFLTILLLLSINAFSQKIKQERAFLKWFFKDKEEEIIQKETILISKDDLYLKREKFSFDSAGLMQALNNQTSKILNQSLAPEKKFLAKTEIETLIENRHDISYLKISSPLFLGAT